MNSEKLFSKRRKTDFIRGPVFVAALLLSVNSSSAREQWQIERPDPPPTAPPATSRYNVGAQNQGQPAPGQVPGLAGSNPYQVSGLAAGGWNGQAGSVPGLAASQSGSIPGLSSQVPGFGHSSQLPALGGAYGGVPGLSGGSGSQPQSIYNNGAQMPGFPGGQVPGLQTQPGQNGFPAGGQVPGLVSQGVPAGVPGMPPLPVQTGQSGVMPDFLKNIVGQRLTAGTVLTGIAESGLSSKGSKRGDVFSIVLPHGFGDGNEMLVPPGSKILGVVVDAFGAKTQKAGMPGRLSVSLKTLVFPDGRTSKINAFIDHNPAHDQESEPKTRFAGFNAGDYGGAIKGMFYSSVSGISWVHNRQMRGKEFVMKPGTPVSVKLNTSLDIAKMNNPAQAFQGTPGLAGVPTQPYPGPNVPGLSGAPGVPGLSQPQGIPGQGYPAAGGIPGMTGVPIPQSAPGQPGVPYGTPQPVPQAGFNQGGGIPGMTSVPIPQSAPGQPGVPYGTPQPVPQSGFNPTQGGGTFFPNDVQVPDQLNSSTPSFSQQQDDPNSIFKTPISSPTVVTPEPF